MGLSLHTENELKGVLAEAEALRRALVNEEYVLHTQEELEVLIHQTKARGRKATSSVHAEHPAITVASTHGEMSHRASLWVLMECEDQDLWCDYVTAFEPSTVQGLVS